VVYFFQENISAFAGVIVMAAYWFALNFQSVNSNIKRISKQRVDKGMAPITEDEKQILKSALHSSAINDSVGALIGGVVALIVTFLIITAF